MILKPHPPGNAEASREEFADGSALVTYPDGSVLILESELAKAAVMGEGRPVNYNDPPPPPPERPLSHEAIEATGGGQVLH